MYLVNHRTEQTADRTTIWADWKSRFHQPADVAITLAPIRQGGYGPQNPAILLTGDTKDVHGAIFGCAEIAWGLGWRPRGMMPAVMNLITGFKILPPTRPGK